MQKSDLFIPEADLASYTMVREYPNWKSQDLPQEIVAAPLYARLHVIQGSFLFRAYDDKEQIIYEEVFFATKSANPAQTQCPPYCDTARRAF